MAYKVHYSDYPGTDTGPPDPERWVGPPGPTGPMGPQGVPGPPGPNFPEAPADGPIYGRGGATPVWTPTLPLSGGTLSGGLSGTTAAFSGAISAGGTGVGAPRFESAGGTDLIISPGGNNRVITFGDPGYGIGTIATMTMATGAMSMTMNGVLQAQQFSSPGSTFTGASNAIPPLLLMQHNYAGTVSGPSYMNYIVVTTDTADARAGANAGMFDLGIQHNVSSAANGGRGTIWSQLNVGTLTNTGLEMTGINSTIFVSGAGGAFCQPLTSSVVLNNGASVGNTINEMMVTAKAGSSVGVKGFLQCTIGPGDVVAGGSFSPFMMFASANSGSAGSPGMGQIISVGNVGQGFPLAAAAGTILGVTLQNANQGSGRNIPFIPPQTFAGIDLQNANFTLASGFAFRSSGFSVDGGGAINVRNARIASTANGVSIDIPNQIVTAAAVAAGGGGGGSGANDYYVGDILLGPNGGQYRVTTVTAGAVTAIAILVPSIAASPPANPVATTGGSGVGCTLTLTWAANNTLTLNPSAGPTTVGGTLTVSGTATFSAPVNVTATGTGTVSRSIQSRWGERYTATDFGIICDGVTDQGAALNAALASMTPGSTLYIPGPIYTTQTILLQAGCFIEMPPGALVRPTGGPTLLVGTISVIGSAALSPVVQIQGNEGGLRHVWITRNGTPAAGSVGLQVYGQNQRFSDCRFYNHARGAQVGGYSAGPTPNSAITTQFDRCVFWNCTENFTYLVQAPETSFFDCRWGMNGATDPSGATSLVTIDGDSNNATAGSPGTISFIRCQFNTGGMPQYSVRFLAVNTGVFKFVGCYSGGATSAFCYVDPGCTLVQNLSFIDSTFWPLASGETFILDTGKKLNALKILGCELSGATAASFSLSGTVNSTIVGNTWGGPSIVALDAMAGGCFIGNVVNTIQTTGAFTNNYIIASNSYTTITQSATGGISYCEPYGTWGSQLTLGKTGQAGRLDLRRGTDGVATAWLGMHTASSTNHVDLTNISGTSNVQLNATAADVFMISGTEVGRFDINGLGISKVTAGAAAPGAGLAKLAFVAGTNAGTGKLVAYCGTSSTPVTITDNIGAGF